MEEIMEAKPLVSIIAICHNHAPYVVETLDSIRNQTYPHIELVIINNLKDECEGIIRNWIDKHGVECTFIQNEQPLNVSQNMNLGLANINGVYFQGISCDDVLMPYKIELQVGVFNSGSNELILVHGSSLLINENGNKIRENKVVQDKSPRNYFKDIFVISFFIDATTVLIKTEVVKLVGGYDESIAVEDFQMWLLLSKDLSHKFYSLGDVILSKRRILGSSMTRTQNLIEYRSLVISKYKDHPYYRFALEQQYLRKKLGEVNERNFRLAVSLILSPNLYKYKRFWHLLKRSLRLK